ncbi:hemagglutinin repeat-containing protein [Pannonibacter sp. Pt2-lr]
MDITSHQGSLLDAGGNLTVTAGRDLSVLGSTLAATGDTRLAAGGDVTIASAENRHRTEQTAKRHHSVKDHGQTVGSLVDTGGSLKITSGGDTAITASSLLAGRTLPLPPPETSPSKVQTPPSASPMPPSPAASCARRREGATPARMSTPAPCCWRAGMSASGPGRT